MNNKDLFEKIAKWITETGTSKTSNGSYYVYFTDISEHFNVTIEWIREHAEDIEECFDWDVVAECDIDDESFGMYFYGNACCEKCGCQASSHCCGCDIAHPEEWDDIEDDEELKIKPTREVAKAIKNYNLKKIFTGSLSFVPNDRYTRSNNYCFDINKFEKDLTEKNFVMVFNHFEQSYACWTVFETPYMDFESIKEIYMKEKDRRLWDSRQLYYDDGNELILMSI